MTHLRVPSDTCGVPLFDVFLQAVDQSNDRFGPCQSRGVAEVSPEVPATYVSLNCLVTRSAQN